MDAAVIGRLALDFDVVHRLTAVPTLGPVRAYASSAAAQAGRCVSVEQGMRGQATIYDVTFLFPIPTSRDARARKATARFDLLVGGNYPVSAPVVRFLSSPPPWNPHVHPGMGGVCVGSYWAEKVLLADLIGQVMRITNYDVPHDGDPHMNRDAESWWRERGYRPINERLPYPMLPIEFTHGVPARSVLRPRSVPAQRAAASPPVLQPRRGAP